MKSTGSVLVVAILGAAALAWAGLSWTRAGGAAVPARAGMRTPSSAEEARKQQLLRENTNLGPDPALADEYEAINADYFGGRLPIVPVRWEERLSDVGPLIADRFRLEGLTDGRLILLNTAIRGDAKQVRRVLCHEMVHVSVWDRQRDHGPLFQQGLRRLADAGAFEGLVASDDEKEQLHEALRVRRTELEAEDRELGRLRAELDADRDRLDADIRDMNARMDAANQRQRDWPDESERRALRDRQGRFEDRVNLFNARLERHRAAIDSFDGDVERYNLMIAYPDGLDRERLATSGGLSAGR
jgi:hypothetical protein